MICAIRNKYWAFSPDPDICRERKIANMRYAKTISGELAKNPVSGELAKLNISERLTKLNISKGLTKLNISKGLTKLNISEGLITITYNGILQDSPLPTMESETFKKEILTCLEGKNPMNGRPMRKVPEFKKRINKKFRWRTFERK